MQVVASNGITRQLAPWHMWMLLLLHVVHVASLPLQAAHESSDGQQGRQATHRHQASSRQPTAESMLCKDAQLGGNFRQCSLKLLVPLCMLLLKCIGDVTTHYTYKKVSAVNYPIVANSEQKYQCCCVGGCRGPWPRSRRRRRQRQRHRHRWRETGLSVDREPMIKMLRFKKKSPNHQQTH
jgi:hypothetical protein